MHGIIFVMVLSPKDNVSNFLSILYVWFLNKRWRVTRDIETIQGWKLLLHNYWVICIINWNNSSSSTLEEFDMAHVNVLFLWENFIVIEKTFILYLFFLQSFKLFIQFFLFFSDWLSKDSYNWHICFGSDMVTCTNHWWACHNFMLTLNIFWSNSTIYKKLF
jgi:hypothetical protein